VNIQFQSSCLEQVPGEVLVLFHFEDQRLPRGPLARADWILNGLVSRLLYLGKFQGRRGESLLLSTSNKFSVDKVLVLGLGRRSDLSGEGLIEGYSSAVTASAKMRVRRIALTLPEEIFPHLTDEAGARLFQMILAAGARAELPLSDLSLVFYEEQEARRNWLASKLREVSLQLSAEYSLEISFV